MVKRVLAIEHATNPNGSDIGYFLNSIITNIREYDIIVAPEFAFATSQVMDKKEKEGLVKKIMEASKGHDTLILPGTFAWQDQGILYNSCPIISDNRTLLKYLKETTDIVDDRLASDNNLRYHTGNHQGIVGWNGLNVGVEICRDHGMGRLKRYLQNFNDSINEVDLQVVLGKGITYKSQNDVTDDKGHLIICDSGNNDKPPNSEVRQNSTPLNCKKVDVGSTYELITP